VLGTLAIGLSLPSVFAAEITWYYVGNPYTTITDPSFGANLTAYITLEYDPASACPTCTNIVDWSFTSGDYTVSLEEDHEYGEGGLTLYFPTGNSYPSQFPDPTTDLFEGEPIGWDFQAESISNGPGGPVLVGMATAFGFAGDTNSYNSAGGNDYNAAGSNIPPGTWTSGPPPGASPEPASFVLLAVGLAGIAWVRNKPRNRA
jgi:hypothetical protein